MKIFTEILLGNITRKKIYKGMEYSVSFSFYQFKYEKSIIDYLLDFL